MSIEIPLFDYIAYIELDDTRLFLIVNSEIVPVSMSFSVCITSYETIILILFYPYCNIEVSTFKIRTKNDFIFSI